MPYRTNPSISLRKKPQQARSNELMEAVLKAAIQVLEREGAPRFTMARVAERAGVSVGSIYQYFPNKAAVLFRLQQDEWKQTNAALSRILKEHGRPPLERLRALVHAFVMSECEEASMRQALRDAAPFYRDAPEAREAKGELDPGVGELLLELLPEASRESRQMAEALICNALAGAGKLFSETPRVPSEITAYSNAMADMFCAYINSLRGQ